MKACVSCRIGWCFRYMEMTCAASADALRCEGDSPGCSVSLHRGVGIRLDCGRGGEVGVLCGDKWGTGAISRGQESLALLEDDLRVDFLWEWVELLTLRIEAPWRLAWCLTGGGRATATRRMAAAGSWL